MESSLNNQLLNQYLQQQLHEQTGGSSAAENQQLRAVEFPDDAIFKEFKNHVKMWMDIDNMIRKLKAVVKERNEVKLQLTEKILRFMVTYNIEDLKTQEGKLRYTVTKAKKAPSKAEIRERIAENYGKVDNLEELVEKIFAKEERAERVALRRVNARKTVEV
jgi:hypothetical protein